MLVVRKCNDMLYYIRTFTLLLYPIVFGLLSCGDMNQTGDAAVDVNQADIEQYIIEISSDEYLGRKPFTEGETKTVAFLEQELKSIGIEPGNGDSYLQEVPLVEITGIPDETMTLKKGEQSTTLQFKEDFVFYTERIQEQIDLNESELVFCGFGITAPEYDWNDFEGIDVKGKTIVVMVNDPGFGGDDPDFFKGNTMTYYGRWTYKYEEAARQGAEAVLIVHETTSAGYPWFVVEGGFTGSQLNLKPGDDDPYKPALLGWITLDVAQDLFTNAGYEFAEEIRKARTKDFKPYSLDHQISFSLKNTYMYDNSNNVVGLIKGTERPDEYLLFSAHWDHLGVGTVVNGDSIYNGALDNGSGVASMLAIAKAMSQSTPPSRSIAFLFVTAEEQGLLGSKYYAENPLYPVAQSVANLNMDGMNPFGPMNYLTITGMGHSEMDDYATAAAEKQGRKVLPDQDPGKGYFYRSDHFNFAKVGIPALYAEGSFEHEEHGKEYIKEKLDSYVAESYHQPSDEYDAETWDLRGIAEDAQLYLDVVRELANSSDWPEWNEGSEFKAAREKSKLKN